MTFQLIVRGERGKHTRGDCAVFDLAAKALPEAIAEAERMLVGDRSKWQAKWQRDYMNRLALTVYLDPEDEQYYGALLSPRADERVLDAWIVAAPVCTFSISTLQAEIRAWTEAQRKIAERDPEYVEYLRLQNKFG